MLLSFIWLLALAVGEKESRVILECLPESIRLIFPGEVSQERLSLPQKEKRQWVEEIEPESVTEREETSKSTHVAKNHTPYTVLHTTWPTYTEVQVSVLPVTLYPYFHSPQLLLYTVFAQLEWLSVQLSMWELERIYDKY